MSNTTAAKRPGRCSVAAGAGGVGGVGGVGADAGVISVNGRLVAGSGWWLSGGSGDCRSGAPGRVRRPRQGAAAGAGAVLARCSRRGRPPRGPRGGALGPVPGEGAGAALAEGARAVPVGP